MGHIIKGKKSYYSVDADMYVSELGYTIPTSPKTRKHYDVFDDDKYSVNDYTVKELDKACKEFQKFNALLEKKFAGVFNVSDHVDGSRIVNVNSIVELGLRKVNDVNSFFTFNLQSGRVYNLPVAKLESAVSQQLTVKEQNVFHNYVNSGGKGYSVKEAVKILGSLKKSVSAVYKQHGYVMSVEDFGTFFTVFRMKQSGQIFGTLNDWLPYMKAGLNMESVKFAFDNVLWKGSKTPVALEQVEELQSMPVEWVKRLLKV